MSMLKGLVYLGVAGVALVVSKGYEGKSLEKYQLTDVHTPVYQSCMSTMKKTKSEFKGGATDYKGCACISRYAASEYEGAQLTAYQEMYEVIVNTAKKSRKTSDSSKQSTHQNDMVTSFITIAAKHDMDMDVVMSMTDSLGNDLKTCGRSTSHRDAALAQIIALPVKGKPAKQTPLVKEPAGNVVSLRGTSDPKKSASGR